ncbi:MAG: hypothetical protein ABI162_02430 [Luteolibacter sp.]
MKSCLGLLFALLIFVAVIGGGALIWYLSTTAEFSRTAVSSAANGKNAPPAAIPVHPAPPVHGKPAAPKLVR